MIWYEIVKIHEKLYKISEDKHWEKTNMYYFIGEERNLLIDTGTGIFPLKHILEEIDVKPIDVVLTHAHWDHLGNVHEFENVYVHSDDMEWVIKGLPLPDEQVIDMMTKNVKEEYLRGFKLPPLKHCSPKNIEEFEFENLEFVHTPGHSPGSLCIYDKDNRALFSGDTIYEGTIYCHFESTNPVKLDESVQKLNKLKVARIYPGHYHMLDSKVILSLNKILNEYKEIGALHHGGGKRCIDNVCIQL